MTTGSLTANLVTNDTSRTFANANADQRFRLRSKQTSKRPLGIWELQGPNNVKPVLVFTPKTPNYKKRFDPEQIVMASADHHMAKALERAFKHELATSK